MARKANTYTFSRTRNKYPWDEWLNGDIWKIVPGEDFTSTVETFRSSATTAAKSRGGKIRSELGEDENLYIQFYEG